MSGTAAESRGAARVRPWPPQNPPGPDERVRATCKHCGLDWDVHEALAGFRLRCECGTWVAVPHPLVPPDRVVAPPAALPLPATWRDSRNLAREARRDRRRHRRSSGFVGTFLLTALVLVPAFLVQSRVPATAGIRLWALQGTLATVLLAVGILFGRARHLDLLRRAPLRHHLEGLGAGLGLGAVAHAFLLAPPSGEASRAWLHGLGLELGLPLAVLALVLLPALGHALLYREVLARRLAVLFRPRLAALAAAVLLALAHGVGSWTPLLLLLALHATWLRGRSRSAVPGLIEELAFAGVALGTWIA